MDALAPGTPCYLVALADYPELSGRVVEVTGAAPAPEGETLPEWYQITATWAREMFHGNEVRAPRCCLRPITGPLQGTGAATGRAATRVCRVQRTHGLRPPGTRSGIQGRTPSGAGGGNLGDPSTWDRVHSCIFSPSVGRFQENNP